MDYVKRNEALGGWNFEVSDMTFGQEIMDRPAVVKVAKEVAKWTCRLIELKLQKEAISGRDQEFLVVCGAHPTGSVSVSAVRHSGWIFQCGDCGMFADTPQEAKGMMWAMYQLAFPEILKKYPQIAEYSIKVSYNRIFCSAGVEMHFVFE